MPINNPPGEQHREQLKIHAEELKKELLRIKLWLDEELGKGNYKIGADGEVFDTASTLERTEEQTKDLERLKRIYSELRKIDPNIIGEVFGK
ncbi:MAG: hypothetical protein ACOZAG_01150 [Patescibacteria group bacterium]